MISGLTRLGPERELVVQVALKVTFPAAARAKFGVVQHEHVLYRGSPFSEITHGQSVADWIFTALGHDKINKFANFQLLAHEKYQLHLVLIKCVTISGELNKGGK